MDIWEKYEEELKRDREAHALNYPYGDLDYRQSQDDPNLYWAFIPEPPATQIDNLVEGAGSVLSLKDVHIHYPKIRKEIILKALLPECNQILAEVVNGKKRQRIAWQQWEKIFIEGEPKFRAKNWVDYGANDLLDVTPMLIDLEGERVRTLDTPVTFTSSSDISRIALSLTCALLEHQAKGADIIKGLQSMADAANVELDALKFKLQEQYLGGWQCKGSANSFVPIGDFIAYVDRAAKSRLK